MADQKREATINRIGDEWVNDHTPNSLERALGKAYDAALADNAERVRILERELEQRGSPNALQDMFARMNDAESALAEARATIERLEGGDHEEGDCASAESTIERLDEALCSLLHKGDDEGEHSPEAHLKLFQNQGGHEPTFDDLCDRVFARARREGFVCKINLSRPRKRKMRKAST